MKFQTLTTEVVVEGIGLHTGVAVRVLLLPRHEPGILFIRRDLPGAPQVLAAPGNIVQTTHATTLEHKGVSLSTTEHLLATLYALNVTNCRIEVNGPEIPILDGSALPWCRAIREAGITPLTYSDSEYSDRPIYHLREPVWIEVGEGQVLGLPHPEFRLSVAVDFGLEYAGRQTCDCIINAANFEAELAPARTFTRAEWLEPLRAQGLIKGGSLDNAIVLETDKPSSPWRMDNEMVRHKALDVVGDLAILTAGDGGVLQAHIIAIKGGHPLHRRWMEQCLQQNALVRRAPKTI